MWEKPKFVLKLSEFVMTTPRFVSILASPSIRVPSNRTTFADTAITEGATRRELNTDNHVMGSVFSETRVTAKRKSCCAVVQRSRGPGGVIKPVRMGARALVGETIEITGGRKGRDQAPGFQVIRAKDVVGARRCRQR